MINVNIDSYGDNMKLKVLFEKLVADYTYPKEELEQYRTPPEVALELFNLCAALANRAKVVVDFCSGTGMLLYIFTYLLNRYGVGLELDLDAIKDARRSPLWRSLLIDYVCCDARKPPLRGKEQYMIISNPPFGTKRKGIDKEILKAIISLNPLGIGLIHYASEPLLNIIKRFLSNHGYIIERLQKSCMRIKQVYKHHVKKTHVVPLLLIVAVRE